MTVTHPMYLVLYLLAAVLLLLAALSVASPRVNLLAAGLLAWVLVPLLGCLGLG